MTIILVLQLITDSVIQIMIKNSISKERHKIRDQIKELIIKYEAFKHKQEQLGSMVPFKEEQLFQIINSIGMRYAKDGYIDQAEKWLKKAEGIASKMPRLQIILHNNMACIYNKKADFNQALYHLNKSQFMAQQMRRKSGYNINYDRLLIDCWLNLSALFSTENMHTQALQILKNTEQFIKQKLESGYQKFVEQLIIAKYNKTVELQHLGKFEQAYNCNEQTKRVLYDKRIYRHFLEKKIQDIHQDLRKKVLNQNKHQKSLSLAVSLNKLNYKIETIKQVQKQKRIEITQSRSRSQYKSLSKGNKEKQIKENYATVSQKQNDKHCRVAFKDRKRESIAHLPLPQTHLRSIINQITNKNL